MTPQLSAIRHRPNMFKLLSVYVFYCVFFSIGLSRLRIKHYYFIIAIQRGRGYAATLTVTMLLGTFQRFFFSIVFCAQY